MLMAVLGKLQDKSTHRWNRRALVSNLRRADDGSRQTYTVRLLSFYHPTTSTDLSKTPNPIPAQSTSTTLPRPHPRLPPFPRRATTTMQWHSTQKTVHRERLRISLEGSPMGLPFPRHQRSIFVGFLVSLHRTNIDLQRSENRYAPEEEGLPPSFARSRRVNIDAHWPNHRPGAKFKGKTSRGRRGRRIHQVSLASGW
jgi:hypothetical protein